ncbi:hypothetical protein Tco_1067997 [Tanacetum coccineum]|uniref:Uncharacterized protein n=1 Tax=Tanacetum coccineum TaxID=301880 RepID=A0ABQ5HGC8_9ASTR
MLSCREGNQEERGLGRMREGANDIFRIAKARERRRRDLGDICFIKYEEGRTITDEEEIKKRWREYFSSFFSTRGNQRDTKTLWTLADCHISMLVLEDQPSRSKDCLTEDGEK